MDWSGSTAPAITLAKIENTADTQTDSRDETHCNHDDPPDHEPARQKALPKTACRSSNHTSLSGNASRFAKFSKFAHQRAADGHVSGTEYLSTGYANEDA